MMEIKALLNNDRAVSPVIGVILMVAITVILAAVIGTFVLGLGNQVGNNAPQATWEYQYNEGSSSGFSQAETSESVVITHQGGDAITRSNIEVSIGGETTSGDITDSTSFDSTITAGGSAEYNESSGLTAPGPIAAGNDVQIIWSSPSGGSSSVISSSTVPSS